MSMKLRLMPSKLALAVLAAATVCLLVALLVGTSIALASRIAVGIGIALILAATIDCMYTQRAWRTVAPTLQRRLPPALAIGVKRTVELTFEVRGTLAWSIRLYDHMDSSLLVDGQPVDLVLRGGTATVSTYTVMPTRRGEVVFAPAELRIRTRLGLLELLTRIGERETRRVYPDFAQVARYAWLAGDRRLSEIGIKTYHQRGEGTDFKQLSEYRFGDPVRHLDWRATLRLEKPVVRQFQNERDQCVMLLIDCGRRMRADDRQDAIGAAHFDQVLNAVMLLSYVALKDGDAVGALTFGTPAGEGRWFAPRKGAIALNALMGELYAVQPSPTHSDYLCAARDLLQRQRKRALVIVITNFRDEDSSEFTQALRLLRSRHLVLPASLRERIVRQMTTQPLEGIDAPLEVASAHLYEQARRDAFQRLAAHSALLVDAEPERLGIELVNRYQAVKRAGLI
jgi:uncharacterized protein (DUF58 family)